jgi:hypothetical protein
MASRYRVSRRSLSLLTVLILGVHSAVVLGTGLLWAGNRKREGYER